MAKRKTSKKAQAGNVLDELGQQVIALGNVVESLFAESVVAVIENHAPDAPAMRGGDYRAHEYWLAADKLCMDLLSKGNLTDSEVRFVWAVGKIVEHLKRTADDSLFISQTLRACSPAHVASARSLASIPRMAQLTQAMLSDAIEAFINRDAAEANGLHLTFRELHTLHEGAHTAFTRAIRSGRVTAAVGASFLSLSDCLQRIGSETIAVATQVSHLYRNNVGAKA